MEVFTTVIEKFISKGEKSGWTFINIPVDVSEKIKPGTKKSFRVKGKLDHYVYHGVSLLPMGNGNFIMPLNATMRKAIGKRLGAMLNVQIEFDKSTYQMNELLMECLHDEPEAINFFNSLTASHQSYFSKWIDAAKTDETKAKRIAQCINAFLKRQNYSEMIRANKANR